MRYALLATRLAPTLGRAHYQVACTHEAAGRIAPALAAARRASQCAALRAPAYRALNHESYTLSPANVTLHTAKSSRRDMR